eukprot:scaffold593_cov382-Prasinococcus_capsulatus_cf.AAC.15
MMPSTPQRQACVCALQSKSTSRFALLAAFLNIDSGGHMDSEGKLFVYHKVKGLKLQMGSPNSKYGGYLNCDGELLAARNGEGAHASHGFDYNSEIEVSLTPRMCRLFNKSSPLKAHECLEVV